MATKKAKKEVTDRHYDEARAQLFATTLQIENAAIKDEREYSKRYFVQALVLLVAIVGYLVAFITTFDFAQLKQSIIDGMAKGEIARLICIIVFITVAVVGIAETVCGGYFGFKVISLRYVPVLSTENAMAPLFKTNKKFNAESSESRRWSMGREELNKYVEQQVVNFQDIADAESEANDERKDDLTACKGCAAFGFLCILVAYIVLSLLCA
jgi:hypothetical protein